MTDIFDKLNSANATVSEILGQTKLFQRPLFQGAYINGIITQRS